MQVGAGKLIWKKTKFFFKKNFKCLNFGVAVDVLFVVQIIIQN